jgi:aminopeptidase N
VWSVPIQVGSVRAPDGAFTLMSARTGQLTRPHCEDTLLVDPHNVGYFRVRYAAPLFDALAQQLPQLPDGARFKLLADTSALVRADQLPLTAYLSLLERLGAEPREAVWGQVLHELKLFDQLLAEHPARERLHRFAIRTLTPRFAELGWDEKSGESSEDRQLRGTLAEGLSDSGDEGVIATARERFARYVADPTTLPPSLVGAVLNIVGRHADQATYDALKRLAERATASEDKFRAYRALGRALDPALAAQALQLARSPEVPRIIRNDIGAIVAESGHVDMAWDDARANADALLADMKLYAGTRYFGELLETATSTARADELEDFARARLPESAFTSVHRAADEIRTRAVLKERLAPQLETALAAWQ